MMGVTEYIGCKFSYGADIHWYLENKMKTEVPLETRPTRTRDDREIFREQKFVWEKRMMDYVERETKLDNNCQKSYALIFGQCTKHMRSKIEANKDYHRMRGGNTECSSSWRPSMG